MNNYEQTIAAQNEAGRRLQIRRIENTISDERRIRTRSAIAAGVFFAGACALCELSGIDNYKAIELEMQAINSFSALKDYFAMFTPAETFALISSASLAFSAFRHDRRLHVAERELNDINEITPDSVIEEWESSKTR